MRSFAFALIAVMAACAPSSRVAPPEMAAADELRVGMITRDYVDDGRRNWDGTGPRPLRTAIWYPATDSAEMTESVTAGLFEGGVVAPGAPIVPHKAQYPLIVLSHGTGGSAVQMMWLGRYLASRGFIVAAVNHHGNTGSEPQRRAQGFLLYWERARDLARVTDRLLADETFGARIDRRRIGAAGFSLGGFTVLLVGGARFSRAQYDAFCASEQRDFTCEPQPEYPTAHAEFALLQDTDEMVRDSLSRSDDSYRDPRIRAVFAIAPAIGSGLTETSLAAIEVPVELVVGDGDLVTPMATNAARIARLVPGARLTTLPGVTHYTFLNRCSDRGVQILDLCRDPAPVNRATIHRQVGDMAVRFFRHSL